MRSLTNKRKNATPAQLQLAQPSRRMSSRERYTGKFKAGEQPNTNCYPPQQDKTLHEHIPAWRWWARRRFCRKRSRTLPRAI